jgi:hypothetical protein
VGLSYPEGAVTTTSSTAGTAAELPPGKSKRTYCACVVGNFNWSTPLEVEGEVATVFQVLPSVDVSTL